MKKFILIIMILISINSYAQNIRIGFTTGVAIANYNAKVDGETDNGSAKAGILAGMLVNIPVARHFNFQPAINFVQKGTQDEQTYNGIKEKMKLNINCIELPLNFLYHTLGTNNFFIGAGPSFSFALSGKMKYKDNNSSSSENVKFGNGDDDVMKRFDMAANFITGYSFRNGLLVSVNYNAGLVNLFPHGSDDGKLTSHYFGITLGYLLKSFSKK